MTPPRHLSNFLAIYANFLLQSEKCWVVYSDESSVAASKSRSGVESEGKTAAASHADRVRANPLARSEGRVRTPCAAVFRLRLRGQAFLSFVAQLVERLSKDAEDRRPIIFFVNNATTYRISKLLRFCERHPILLFFSLPQKSKFNPIEFCWRFIKRDFRRLTDHSR